MVAVDRSQSVGLGSLLDKHEVTSQSGVGGVAKDLIGHHKDVSDSRNHATANDVRPLDVNVARHKLREKVLLLYAY